MLGMHRGLARCTHSDVCAIVILYTETHPWTFNAGLVGFADVRGMYI